jgi:hypothetical protein
MRGVCFIPTQKSTFEWALLIAPLQHSRLSSSSSNNHDGTRSHQQELIPANASTPCAPCLLTQRLAAGAAFALRLPLDT